MNIAKQTVTQWVDFQVGEEKFLIQVEEAYDEVGQNPADTGGNTVKKKKKEKYKFNKKYKIQL